MCSLWLQIKFGYNENIYYIKKAAETLFQQKLLNDYVNVERKTKLSFTCKS